MLPRRTYTTITLTMLLVSGTVWTIIAMLWIHGLSLRYPAPFIGMPGRCCFLEVKILSDMEVSPSFRQLSLLAIYGMYAYICCCMVRAQKYDGLVELSGVRAGKGRIFGWAVPLRLLSLLENELF